MRGPFYIDVQFAPNVDLVPVVRRFVTDFYEQVLADRALVAKVALATHELLENAVRYSTTGETKVTLEIADEDSVRVLRIRTRNQATPEHLAKVKQAIDEIRGAGDPDAYYQELIGRTAKIPVGSGLGLGRIFAEADMSMSCSTEGDVLVLQAQTRIAPTEAP